MDHMGRRGGGGGVDVGVQWWMGNDTMAVNVRLAEMQ